MQANSGKVNCSHCVPICPYEETASIPTALSDSSLSTDLQAKSATYEIGDNVAKNGTKSNVNFAKLVIHKSADRLVAYINDTITYQISITNTGNTSANNVIITDPISPSAALVPGSLSVSVAYVSLPGGAIRLSNPIPSNTNIAISFKVIVTSIPASNVLLNKAVADFTYTADPHCPNGASGKAHSNIVKTTIMCHNFEQQVNDIIESVALQQAAIAALANAEGAKIQRFVAMPCVTTCQLLCLNQSVIEMVDLLISLEGVLRKKLESVKCQFDGNNC